MAAQKQKKHLGRIFLHFSMPINPKPNKSRLSALAISGSYGRLLQNPKTGGFRESFLPENDFKTCSTVNFPIKHPDFSSLEPTKDIKFRLSFCLSHPLVHMNSI